MRSCPRSLTHLNEVEVSPWTGRFFSVHAASLAWHNTLLTLRGNASEMGDKLLLRRDSIGVAGLTVGSADLDKIAPCWALTARIPAAIPAFGGQEAALCGLSHLRAAS